MREELSYGITPCDEPCAQVGSADYYERVRIEGHAYIDQLKRIYKEAHGCDLPLNLRLKSFPHDFGSYHEVVAVFSMEDEAMVEAAYWLDENCPASWDDEAKKLL